MPRPRKAPRFGGSPSHDRLIMANLATDLFMHEKVTTTQAKAKALRPYAEKLITKARRGICTLAGSCSRRFTTRQQWPNYSKRWLPVTKIARGATSESPNSDRAAAMAPKRR